LKILIKNGTVINEGLSFKGSLLIQNSLISRVFKESAFASATEYEKEIETVGSTCDKVINAEGLHILPGVIDDQVHFREPGDGKRGTIESESKAAVLGGVTSFMDMPNNNPPAITIEQLEKKYEIGKERAFANYSFYMGTTNDNIEEVKKVEPRKVCGVKVFMGSSTGNMLVDSPLALQEIFEFSPVLIATHCEKQEIIDKNLKFYRAKYGDDIPVRFHSAIRSREACVASSKIAIALAKKNNARLHILHISTAQEIAMLRQEQRNEKISGEVCVHYLWFCNKDYAKYGSLIRCNPALKDEEDMEAIRDGVRDGVVNVVATDHAPHLLEDKKKSYMHAPGGIPLVQYSLQMMLELYKRGVFTLAQVVEKMSHGPAKCFNVSKRGFLREGYYADIVLVNLSKEDSYSPSHPVSMCGWSPYSVKDFTEFGGQKEESTLAFSSSIEEVFVNGVQMVSSGKLTGERDVMRLEFDR
jgi:dihydroorotase